MSCMCLVGGETGSSADGIIYMQIMNAASYMRIPSVVQSFF